LSEEGVSLDEANLVKQLLRQHCFDYEEQVYLPFYGTKPVCLTANNYFTEECDSENGLIDEESTFIT